MFMVVLFLSELELSCGKNVPAVYKYSCHKLVYCNIFSAGSSAVLPKLIFFSYGTGNY